ncbi:EpsG family protein [Treponema brennaborense]|nr:EpsG family protein [Treponema brennaborense]
MTLMIPALFSYPKQISFNVMMFLFIPLFLLSAMRYDIGRDYDSYMIIFNNPEKMQVHEKGYMLLNNLAINYDLTLQAVIIIYAMFTSIFAFLFISENSKNKILSLFIFYTYTPFYLQTLNTLRQGLAIYIFMYATRFIRERKLFKYCFFILMAAFFAHSSVLVTLPLYFLLNRKYRTTTKMVLVGIFVGMSSLMHLIIKATPYAVYLLGSSGEGSFSPVFILDVLLCVVVVLFMVNNHEYIFYNIAFLSICILSMGIALNDSPIFVVVSRINEFFLPGLIIMIPSFIHKQKKYKEIGYYACILCFFCVFYFSILMNGVENQLVPYKTFFGVYHTGIFFDISMIVIAGMFSLFLLKITDSLQKNKIGNFFI